jgi:hypothetical protein
LSLLTRIVFEARATAARSMPMAKEAWYRATKAEGPGRATRATSLDALLGRDLRSGLKPKRHPAVVRDDDAFARTKSSELTVEIRKPFVERW